MNEIISEVNSMDDLGVIFDQKANFQEHYKKITSKAYKSIFMLNRSFKFSSMNVKTRLYKSFILPLVEYASSVWNPHKRMNCITIERVQRRATKYILGNSSLTYNERLKICKLDKLESCRAIADLCIVFKLIHYNIPQFNKPC